jgi:hypothetical protein
VAGMCPFAGMAQFRTCLTVMTAPWSAPLKDEGGVQATTFSQMAVAVGNGETKRGLAAEVMTALRVRAVEAGLLPVIARYDRP